MLLIAPVSTSRDTTFTFPGPGPVTTTTDRGSAATPTGVPGTAIVCISPDSGSSLETVLSEKFVTHTYPPPTATSLASRPTSNAVTVFVFGSMRTSDGARKRRRGPGSPCVADEPATAIRGQGDAGDRGQNRGARHQRRAGRPQPERVAGGRDELAAGLVAVVRVLGERGAMTASTVREVGSRR